VSRFEIYLLQTGQWATQADRQQCGTGFVKTNFGFLSFARVQCGAPKFWQRDADKLLVVANADPPFSV